MSITTCESIRASAIHGRLIRDAYHRAKRSLRRLQAISLLDKIENVVPAPFADIDEAASRCYLLAIERQQAALLVLATCIMILIASLIRASWLTALDAIRPPLPEGLFELLYEPAPGEGSDRGRRLVGAQRIDDNRPANLLVRIGDIVVALFTRFKNLLNQLREIGSGAASESYFLFDHDDDDRVGLKDVIESFRRIFNVVSFVVFSPISKGVMKLVDVILPPSPEKKFREAGEKADDQNKQPCIGVMVYERVQQRFEKRWEEIRTYSANNFFYDPCPLIEKVADLVILCLVYIIKSISSLV